MQKGKRWASVGDSDCVGGRIEVVAGICILKRISCDSKVGDPRTIL